MRGSSRQARIIDSLDAANTLFARAFADARDERLHVAHLDAERRLIGLRICYATEGEPVAFPVRAIIADALSLQSAALIIAHNHPSGDPEPSATDIETMRSLIQVARPLGIAIHDHLVFGGGRFVSFRQRGLL